MSRMYRIFETSNEDFSIAPRGVVPGDRVCVIEACDVPIVLREIESGYAFVGPCFVDSLMYWEAVRCLDSEESEVERFIVL